MAFSHVTYWREAAAFAARTSTALSTVTISNNYNKSAGSASAGYCYKLTPHAKAITKRVAFLQHRQGIEAITKELHFCSIGRVLLQAGDASEVDSLACRASCEIVT